jgi:hypothetical protein
MDVLMMHALRKEYFRLPLERFRLTFDDGLFSHYYYFPLLSQHPRPLTVFIATAFIRPGAARPAFSGRYLEFQETAAYSRRAFIESDLRDFMTVEEVQFLAARPNVAIGAHSHFHEVTLTDVHPKKPRPMSAWKLERFAEVPPDVRTGLSIRSRLAFPGHEFRQDRLVRRSEAQWIDYIQRDTELCLEWFTRHLKRVPEIYGFPFNEYSSKLIAILKSFGFREFYAGSSVKHPEVIGRLDAEDMLRRGHGQPEGGSA